MIVTVDAVMRLSPCGSWTRERVAKIGARYGGVPTLSELLSDRRISLVDRVWLFAKLAPKPMRQEWAYACADRAVRVHAVKALRAAGLTEQAKQLCALERVCDARTANAAGAAGDAAGAAWAAGDAAGDAAWAAAWAAWAAGDAAGDAAWAAGAARAARAAARAAGAAGAARAAAGNRELQRALKHARELLNEKETC